VGGAVYGSKAPHGAARHSTAPHGNASGVKEVERHRRAVGRYDMDCRNAVHLARSHGVEWLTPLSVPVLPVTRPPHYCGAAWWVIEWVCHRQMIDWSAATSTCWVDTRLTTGQCWSLPPTRSSPPRCNGKNVQYLNPDLKCRIKNRTRNLSSHVDMHTPRRLDAHSHFYLLTSKSTRAEFLLRFYVYHVWCW